MERSVPRRAASGGIDREVRFENANRGTDRVLVSEFVKNLAYSGYALVLGPVARYDDLVRPQRLSRPRSAFLVVLVGGLVSSLACTNLDGLSGRGSPDADASESGAPAEDAGREDAGGDDAGTSVVIDSGDGGDAMTPCAPNANTHYCEDFDHDFTVNTPPMRSFGGSCALSSEQAKSAPNALKVAVGTGGTCYRDPVPLPPGPSNLRATTRLWFDALQGRVHILDFLTSTGLQERWLFVNFGADLVEITSYASLPDGGPGSYKLLASTAYTPALGRWIDVEFRLEGLGTTPTAALLVDGLERIKVATSNWTNPTNLQFIMGVSYANAPVTLFLDDVKVERF